LRTLCVSYLHLLILSYFIISYNDKFSFFIKLAVRAGSLACGLIWTFMLQDYPQRMRLERRLYGICTVILLKFMIPCNCKQVSFYVKSLNYSEYMYNMYISLIYPFESSYFKSLRSSLRSYPLWV